MAKMKTIKFRVPAEVARSLVTAAHKIREVYPGGEPIRGPADAVQVLASYAIQSFAVERWIEAHAHVDEARARMAEHGRLDA